MAGEWSGFFSGFKRPSRGKFDQARFYLKACVLLSKIAPEMNKYLYTCFNLMPLKGGLGIRVFQNALMSKNLREHFAKYVVIQN